MILFYLFNCQKVVTIAYDNNNYSLFSIKYYISCSSLAALDLVTIEIARSLVMINECFDG